MPSSYDAEGDAASPPYVTNPCAEHVEHGVEHLA
jgi:hypothetical protein